MSKIRKALAPYSRLITPVLLVILVAFVFVQGCNYGKNKQEAEVVRLSGQVQALTEANKEIPGQGKLAKEEANKQAATSKAVQKQTAAAAERAAAQRAKTEAAIQESEKELGKALSNPKCNELLEISVCPNIPIP